MDFSLQHHLPKEPPVTDTTIQPTLIVAVDRVGTIGKNNTIPWSLKTDLEHFKRTTMGSIMIMGRKTYESIGRPLPGRTTIVVSRTLKKIDGVQVVPTIEDAELLAVRWCIANKKTTYYVVGGSKIYEYYHRRAKRMWVTVVDTKVEGGDTFFTMHRMKEWELKSRGRYQADRFNEHDFEIFYGIKINRSL